VGADEGATPHWRVRPFCSLLPVECSDVFDDFPGQTLEFETGEESFGLRGGAFHKAFRDVDRTARKQGAFRQKPFQELAATVSIIDGVDNNGGIQQGTWSRSIWLSGVAGVSQIARQTPVGFHGPS